MTIVIRIFRLKNGTLTRDTPSYGKCAHEYSCFNDTWADYSYLDGSTTIMDAWSLPKDVQLLLTLTED